MKGKKKDTQFISLFLEDCIKQGLIESSQIVQHAQQIINNIDQKIKEVEQLKIKRSKLLDVLEIFPAEQVLSIPEVLVISFFQITGDLPKRICNLLKKKPITKKQIGVGFTQHQINFCLKQLLQQNIIEREGNVFRRGKNFDLYLETVFQEKQC
jgi:predicted transcriptional regulator